MIATKIDEKPALAQFLHENKDKISQAATACRMSPVEFCPPLEPDDAEKVTFMVGSVGISGQQKFVKWLGNQLKSFGINNGIKIYSKEVSESLISLNSSNYTTILRQAAIDSAIPVAEIQYIPFNQQFQEKLQERRAGMDLVNEGFSNASNLPQQEQQYNSTPLAAAGAGSDDWVHVTPKRPKIDHKESKISPSTQTIVSRSEAHDQFQEGLRAGGRSGGKKSNSKPDAKMIPESASSMEDSEQEEGKGSGGFELN